MRAPTSLRSSSEIRHRGSDALPYHIHIPIPLSLNSSARVGYQGRGGIASYRAMVSNARQIWRGGFHEWKVAGRAPIGVMAKAARRGLARPTTEGFPSSAILES